MIQEMEPEDKRPESQDRGQTDSAADVETDANASKADASKPLTTQGTQEEIEENLGGTTNLSLDQLKKEGDAGQ